MTKNEILEGNKLIAEFMGNEMIEISIPFQYELGVPLPISGNTCTIDNADEEVRLEIDEGNINGAEMMTEILNYNSSWDKLMPVVEKIESTNRKVEISECTCFIYPNETLENYDEYNYEITTIYPTKIKAVYNAVVKFIKWYNQSKLADKVFKKKTYRSRKNCKYHDGTYFCSENRFGKNNISLCIGVNCGYYKEK